MLHRRSGTVLRRSVTALEAVFEFPIARKYRWSWYRVSTADNLQEYAWTVKVKTPRGAYVFGFILFKFPGQPPARGNLSKLIRTGQADIWCCDDQGASVVPGKVHVLEKPGAITVSIRNRVLLKRLFRSRPETVELESEIPGEGRSVRRVAVEYQ